MIFVVIIALMFVFVMAVGVATSTLMALSVMTVLVIVIRHYFSGRLGFGCAGFRYIFPNSRAGSTPYPGTHYSTSLAPNRLANCGTSRPSGGTTDNRAGLAVTLGSRRGTYAAAHGATDNRACLAADGLPNRRARSSTHAATDSSLGITVGSP